jgi:hypothetical protein
MFDVDVFVARGHEKVIAYYTWLRDTVRGSRKNAPAFRNALRRRATRCGAFWSGTPRTFRTRPDGESEAVGQLGNDDFRNSAIARASSIWQALRMRA